MDASISKRQIAKNAHNKKLEKEDREKFEYFNQLSQSIFLETDDEELTRFLIYLRLSIKPNTVYMLYNKIDLIQIIERSCQASHNFTGDDFAWFRLNVAKFIRYLSITTDMVLSNFYFTNIKFNRSIIMRGLSDAINSEDRDFILELLLDIVQNDFPHDKRIISFDYPLLGVFEKICYGYFVYKKSDNLDVNLDYLPKLLSIIESKLSLLTESSYLKIISIGLDTARRNLQRKNTRAKEVGFFIRQEFYDFKTRTKPFSNWIDEQKES